MYNSPFLHGAVVMCCWHRSIIIKTLSEAFRSFGYLEVWGARNGACCTVQITSHVWKGKKASQDCWDKACEKSKCTFRPVGMLCSWGVSLLASRVFTLHQTRKEDKKGKGISCSGFRRQALRTWGIRLSFLVGFPCALFVSRGLRFLVGADENMKCAQFCEEVLRIGWVVHERKHASPYLPFAPSPCLPKQNCVCWTTKG